MNELIAPLIFAAVMSAGDGLQSGAAAKETAPQAPLQASLYRAVDGDSEIKRGERLPARYQTHEHVVENWRARRLAKPPRGHQWVQAGSRYALVAIATGRVAQVVMGR